MFTEYLKYRRWLIYLRKSRQDDPDETVAQVLAKHEEILQEFARRELGGEIPEENIYREVASGESIAERVEVKKVLARIEDPEIEGVLVVEASRLSRGDLADCSKVINAFRFSKSQVATPMMTYDLNNKMERKFFQDELLRGNDYLEYTKEILFRGRVAAVKRGCYIGRVAPYGYTKVKKGKDHTLEIIEDQAAVVRLVFDLYTRDLLTPFQIAERLNAMQIPAPRAAKWKKDTIRHMVRNAHYVGKVVFNKIKTTQVLENGEVVSKKLTQPDDVVIIAQGKHTAIIDAVTWEKAQALVARNPRVKHEYPLKNPLSGLIVCGVCGRAMYIHSYKKAEDRYECRSKPRCLKSVRMSELLGAVTYALEHAELPALEVRLKNDDGNARKIQQRQIEKLEKLLEEYRAQEEEQFDLLETKVYTPDVFERRNAKLRAKIEETQTELFKARSVMPEHVDFEERIVTLRAAIEALKDTEATPTEKNKILKSIVDRIEYHGPPSDRDNKKRQNRKGADPFTLDITLRF